MEMEEEEGASSPVATNEFEESAGGMLGKRGLGAGGSISFASMSLAPSSKLSAAGKSAAGMSAAACPGATGSPTQKMKLAHNLSSQRDEERRATAAAQPQQAANVGAPAAAALGPGAIRACAPPASAGSHPTGNIGASSCRSEEATTPGAAPECRTALPVRRAADPSTPNAGGGGASGWEALKHSVPALLLSPGEGGGGSGKGTFTDRVDELERKVHGAVLSQVSAEVPTALVQRISELEVLFARHPPAHTSIPARLTALEDAI